MSFREVVWLVVLCCQSLAAGALVGALVASLEPETQGNVALAVFAVSSAVLLIDVLYDDECYVY